MDELITPRFPRERLEAVVDRLAEAVAAATGHPAPRLPSGATHDASAMADLCPVAMLFLRCRGGLSHHPAEHAAPADMRLAIDTLCTFLTALEPPPAV